MSEALTFEAPAPANTAVAAWLRQLAERPDRAIDALLLRQSWLGGYSSLEPPEAVPQFLPVDLEARLDEGLQSWVNVQTQRHDLPEGIDAEQRADALSNAFGLLQTLDLPLCHRWCRENVVRLWSWLSTQPSTAASNPRSAFLRALALRQPNRDMLPFWMALCRHARGDELPILQLALFGLRRMPVDDEGHAADGLPEALVGGLVDYGIALSRRGQSHKKEWLAEVDFLTAVYPMSAGRWRERLRTAMSHRPQDVVARLWEWLDERLPAIKDVGRPARRVPFLQSPHWENDVRPLLDQFDSRVDMARPELKAVFQRYRHYAHETGDSYFLVRSFSRAAEFLLKPPREEEHEARDATWALELGQEAATWAPGNPFCWSAIARALDSHGDWPRAGATFWYARRRFPYNAHSHNQLGHALAMRGFLDESESVYRAAIRRFPDNPVCWADLGHTLRLAGELERALAIYRQAQAAFHRDPAICTALAGVLIDLGRAGEAESAQRWAESLFQDSNSRTRSTLAEQRLRLTALMHGHRSPSRRSAHPPVRETGDWSALEGIAGIGLRGIDALGQATLWRQATTEGRATRAQESLEAARPMLGDDARWVSEYGLWLAASSGWPAAMTFFDQAAARRPGDGALALLRLEAHAHCGEAPDWAGLRGRFEQLAPLIRTAHDPHVRRPAELDEAVLAATKDGKIDMDELDEEARQALWIYDTAADRTVSDLARQDFLAAQQLMVL